MKIISLLALCLLTTITTVSSCDSNEKDEPIDKGDRNSDNYYTDNNIKLVKVVNTGLCYNDDELQEIFKRGNSIETVNDTINVYVAAHANRVTDSMTVNYFSKEDKLLVLASPYFNYEYSYPDALCILTRKLQFVAQKPREYKLCSVDEYTK